MRILGTVTTRHSHAELVRSYARFAGAEIVSTEQGRLHIVFAASKSPTTDLQSDRGTLSAIDTHGPPIGSDLVAAGRELVESFKSERWGRIAQTQQTMAIWDAESGRLALVRDRVGIPPLFVAEDDRGVTWSTEMRPLVELGADAALDELALAGFLMNGYVMHPRTFFTGIRRVPAAHWLSTDGTTTNIRRYWAPKKEPGNVGPSNSDTMEETLAASIDKLQDRGAATAALLSGGVDSTAIAAIGAGVANVDLKTYTFRYADYEGPMNEASAAAKTADALGLEHSDIVLSAEYLMQSLDRLIGDYEEPMSYGLHSSRMSPIADDGSRVVLTGSEGTEWGLTPKMIRAIDLAGTIPRPVLSTLAGVVEGAETGYRKRARTFLELATDDAAQRYLHLSVNHLIRPSSVDALLVDDGLTGRARQEIRRAMTALLDEIPGLSEADKVIYIGLGAFGAEHICAWSHRWARAAGLSVRFPLMDSTWIDLMASQPEKDATKQDFRSVVRRHLPSHVTIGGKYPQGIPLTDWFRGPMASYLEEKLSRERVEAEGSFDATTVAKLLDEHLSARADRRWELWSVLAFLEWRDVVRTWRWDAPS